MKFFSKPIIFFLLLCSLLIAPYHCHINAIKNKTKATLFEYNPPLTGFIIYNIRECGSCNIPLNLLFNQLKDIKCIAWYLVFDSEMTQEGIQRFIQQHHLDTTGSNLKIITDTLLYKKYTKKKYQPSMIIVKDDNKVLYQQTFEKYNYTALKQKMNQYINQCGYDLYSLNINNPYHQNLFVSSFNLYQRPLFFACYPPLHYAAIYHVLNAKKMKDTLFQLKPFHYFQIVRKILDEQAFAKNEKIIQENQLDNMNYLVELVQFIYSNRSSHYLIFNFYRYADTIYKKQNMISSHKMNFLLKTDSILNATDTLFFKENYLIVSESNGVVVNDTLFYFLRYSPKHKKYVFSEFVVQNKLLNLVKDIMIPYEKRDDYSVPKIKLGEANKIYLFFYSKNEHSKVFQYKIGDNDIEVIFSRKKTFISYTMFYEWNTNEYIYLINKNNKLGIEKYNLNTNSFQTILDDLTKTNTIPIHNWNTSTEKIYPFFVQNNRVFFLGFREN